MKNFVKKGEIIDFVNSTGNAINSGDVVPVGIFFGVAQTNIAVNATGAVLLKGAFNIAKAAQAFAQGVKLYWDATNKVVTTTATNNTAIGAAAVAALSGDATAVVQLVNGI